MTAIRASRASGSWACSRAFAREMCGSIPDAEVVIMSTGRLPATLVLEPAATNAWDVSPWNYVRLDLHNEGPGVVTVEVDTIAQPHAMVSGNVTFSDGEKAYWYIDHQGRPGMAARTPGYHPTPQDITDFQVKLDAALRQAGY